MRVREAVSSEFLIKLDGKLPCFCEKNSYASSSKPEIPSFLPLVQRENKPVGLSRVTVRSVCLEDLHCLLLLFFPASPVVIIVFLLDAWIIAFLPRHGMGC